MENAVENRKKFIQNKTQQMKVKIQFSLRKIHVRHTKYCERINQSHHNKSKQYKKYDIQNTQQLIMNYNHSFLRQRKKTILCEARKVL